MNDAPGGGEPTGQHPEGSADENSTPDGADGRRRTRRWWLWGGAVVLLMLVAGAAWVTVRALSARDNLTAARTAIATAQQADVSELGDLDLDALSASVADAQQAAAAARADVEDPVYRMATALPWIGTNLSAVTAVTVTVDEVAQQVLPPLLTLATVADPSSLEPRDNSIDLAPIVAAAPVLRSADDIVAQGQDRVAAIDRDGLVGAVQEGVDELSASLDRLRGFTQTGARLTATVPPMLGSEGTRRYLVVFQNLAELRATGGIFGSYAVLTATGGHLDLTGQGSTSRTIGRFDTPVEPLTPEQLAVYGTNIATIPMDVNFSPDFPLAAELFTTMYQQRIDPAPFDGVIAVDPVALADVLQGYDPVTVQGMTLNSDTVVRLLLSDVYMLYSDDKDQSERDAFLSDANAAAFDAVTATPRDMGAVFAGLRKALDERRILLYSTHPQEQAQIRAAGFSGELPATDTAATPTFGIFLTDRTHKGSKLGYYLSGAVDLTAGSCRADGGREVTAQVQLDFDAPTSGLPEYVSGIGPMPYVLVTEFRAFAPTGGTVTGAEFDGAPVEMVTGTDLDRSVGVFRVNLQPGSSTTVTLHFLLPPDGDGAAQTVQPSVRLAPAITEWPITAPEFPACEDTPPSGS